MNSNKSKALKLLTILLVIIAVILGLVHTSILKASREKKEGEAYLYGQTVVDSICLTLDNTLKVSESLKYFYMHYGESCFEKFDEIAASIAVDNPVIGSMYIAPKAVIQVAYPKEVNAATIGFAMLEDSEQGPRAQKAIDTKRVTVAGPHELVEGGIGFIIRNPIFKDDEFVGFTIIVLNWDKFVKQIFANVPSSDKYKIAVWKEDFDEHAVTDEDGFIFRNSAEPISKNIDISFTVPNDTWHLVVEPINGWGVHKEALQSMLFSIFVALVVMTIFILLYISNENKKALHETLLEQRVQEKSRAELEAARKEAEAANIAKTTFLNNMSHDIRTPMNVILGFTELMKTKTDKPEIIKDYLYKIEESGKYLLSIINNVLDMASIDSGKAELKIELFDIFEDNSGLFDAFIAEMKQKNIKFEWVRDIQHRYILTDKAKMRQILVNILSNAIKYTPEGGSITLVSKEVPGDKPGYATYISEIIDTGIGMSQEFQKHIFDSFSRERTTTESKIAGSGLGMAIVKKLADLLGDTLEVESKIGKGSTFRLISQNVYIENPEVYYNKIEKEKPSYNPAGKHVLLAEDNDLNAEIAEELFGDIGLVIDRAKDGGECVKKLMDAAENYYDFILMDIQMPYMDGYEATRRIRKIRDSKKAKIPIIAMTANAFEQDKRKAIDSGMNGHIAKPISIEALLAELSKLFAD